MFTTRCQLAIAFAPLMALASSLLSCSAASAGKPAPTPIYLLTDLGPGDTTHGYPPLNNPDGGGVLLIAGQLESRPAVWSADATNGEILDLATLPFDGVGRAVNDAGVLVGYSIAAGSFVSTPGNGVVSLPELGNWSHPLGVANSGDIVGWYHLNGSADRLGILWHVDSLGNVTSTSDLGTFSPNDINEWGLMAGKKWLTPNWGVPAMAWFEDGQLIVQELSNGEGEAYAVNNLGKVVGCWFNGSTLRPTLWDAVSGTTTDLGDLGSGGWPLGINDQGQVVGRAYVTSKRGYRAFLWQNGTMVDLNTLAGLGRGDPEMYEAKGINETGHIVGSMTTVDGSHRFLLTPTP